jgi:secondary thiamine-phosphate synthase enzyme
MEETILWYARSRNVVNPKTTDGPAERTIRIRAVHAQGGIDMSERAPILYCETVEVSLQIGPDIQDITRDLSTIVGKAGIAEGSLHATVIGSTGSVTTIEYEPGVVEDLKRAIRRLAPPEEDYAHELAWHDGNGHSHVQAALLGPSLVVPVRGAALALGTWQQVVVINHDNKPRKRRVEITLMGA